MRLLKLHFAPLLILVWLLCSPGSFAASAGGATVQLNGQYQTSGGSATYFLPIGIPAGRAGLQPKLGLAYQSSGSNGPLGMGWKLDGLSGLSRCGKNLVTDNRWGGINFNSEDRYCLDGQRLIAITGPDGSNGTEYRIENNGYSRIISYGSVGGGPEYFKVWHKDGSVSEYGATAESRTFLGSAGTIFQWLLSKQTDITGNNSIIYNYSRPDNTHIPLINKISYTGGSLSFFYEQRNDKSSFYLSGNLFRQNRRLTTVQTLDSQNEVTGNYSLSYHYSAGTARSLLDTITYCAGGHCSTPVNFTWADNGNITFSAKSSTGFTAPRYFDINGNGQATAYGVTTVTDNTSAADPNKNRLTVNDLNGIAHAAITSFSLSGNRFSPTLTFNQCENNSANSYLNAAGEFVSYCRFSQCVNDSCKYASKGVNDGDFDGNGSSETVSGYLAADFNGDGRDDKHNFDIPGGSYQYILSDGVSGTLPDGGTKVLKAIADVNLDGYLDVIMGPSSGEDNLYLYLFTGHQFSAPIKLNNRVSDTTPVVIGDITGDGYAELGVGNVIYLNEFVSKADSNPATMFSVSKLDAQQPLYSLRDVNNDGLLDILSKAKDDEYTKVDKQLSVAHVQDKIVQITEFGIAYNITYTPASDNSVYQFTSSPNKVFPFIDVTPAQYLVARVSKSPQGYAETTYQYHYQGAKSHLKGGGFLGFAQITETETASVITETTTEYEQLDLKKVGKPLHVTVKKNGNTVSDITYQYQVSTYSGRTATYYQVYANQVTTRLFSPGSAIADKQEIVQQWQDSLGNLIQQTHHYSSEQSGGGEYGSTSNYEYLSPWVNPYNYIYQVNESSSSSSILSQLQTYEKGIQRYCSDNGEIYFKPNDVIILIPSTIDIPIVLKQYNDYFKYQPEEVTDIDTTLLSTNTWTQNGTLISVSKAEFESKNLYSCGMVNLAYDATIKHAQLTTQSLSYNQIATVNGDNFWKSAALKTVVTTLTDNDGVSRTTQQQMEYTDSGLISRLVSTGSAYDSQSPGAKSKTETYTYDQWGNLLSQTVSGSDLSSRTTSYTYDNAALYRIATTNAAGHRTTSQYNARGELIGTVSPLKARTSNYVYDWVGRQTSETLPGIGNTSTTDYQLGTECPYASEQTVSCTIDTPAAGGKIITLFDYADREIRKLHQDFSGRWVSVETVWDLNGRKVSQTRPHFVRDTLSAPKVTFTYDELNRETSRTEPSDDSAPATFTTQYNGLKVTERDAKGNVHTTTTNVMGYAMLKEEPTGAYQTYSYYPDGMLRSSTDSSGNVTRVSYDNLGYRSRLDDPDIGVWDYTYNAAGELIYSRNENGIVTSISYDSLGRKVSQTEGGQASSWTYDGHSAAGTLTSFTGYGNTTEYTYNTSGLPYEVAVTVDGERFSTRYTYDGYERVTQEERPNGGKAETTERLAVQYVYNPFGYLSAVRSPRNAADAEFTSAKFRSEIQQLLDQAIAQATQYLDKAELYARQKNYYTTKAQTVRNGLLNEYQIDAASLSYIGSRDYFAQWCSDRGECYVRPKTWILVGNDILAPISAIVEGEYYQLATTDSSGSVSLQPISQQQFESLALTRQNDLAVSASDGQQTLLNVGAILDSETRDNLYLTAQDLEEAAAIADSRYQHYTELADKLISLSEKVAVLSGLYCNDAQLLGGTHSKLANLWGNCATPTKPGQADYLQLVLDQSQQEASVNSQAYIYYWQRKATDAYDHTLSEVLGNGLVNSYVHSASTGLPSLIQTKDGNTSIRGLYYTYDVHNNVVRRFDDELGITDNWTYDTQDRVISNRIALTDSTRHGLNNPDLSGPFDYQYDKLGNLTFKTGIGDYQYNSKAAGPHAVVNANGLTYQYDKVGNMLRAYSGSTTERSMSWTPFNKPASITRNGKTVEFSYDANHNRYQKKTSDGLTTLYFGKSYERVTDSKTGEVQHKHYIFADGKLIALNTQTRDQNDQLKNKQVRYLHYDALNSVDMITDGYGNIVERRSYDTWGKQRKVSWSSSDASTLLQAAITNRGYTGHEEITEVGLIHMNGRVYDQELGRFTSADPIIQAPYLVNSFNRYSYVMNNPLKYTDPKGYTWSSVASSISSAFSSAWSSITSVFSGKNSSSPSNGSNSSSSNNNSPSSRNNKPSSASTETEPQDSVTSDIGQNALTEVASNNGSVKPENKKEDNELVHALASVVPFGNTIYHAVKGEWNQAAEALAADATEVAIGAATFGVGAVAIKGYKGYKVYKAGKELAAGAEAAGGLISVAEEASVVTKSGDDLAKMSGQLRDAAKGKGNFGLGTTTRSQADEMGKAWVGKDPKLASDGKTLVSKDGYRQYRPPSTKPNSPHATTGVQANLERRFKPEGQWQGNGHLDIVD